MTPAERTRWICHHARAIGFDLCGVAPAAPFDDLARLPEWLARGYAGGMEYLRDPRRADPRLILEGARSVIVVALNYNSARRYSVKVRPGADDPSPRGWISRYAWGDDYHEVIGEKLNALVAAMRTQFPKPFEARSYVDTGPVIERVAAKHAGLGWLAKNTCLINQELGSWLFLGVVVNTLALESSLAIADPPPADLCGSCTRCLDACPTGAFPQPYVLDSRRCISYLTIELRGAVPEELRPQMGRAIIGCDICQDVCPWNRMAPVTALAAFQPRENFDNHFEDQSTGADSGDQEVTKVEPRNSLFSPELEWLAALSQREFSAVFRHSAVKRVKWRGLVRNACIALANSRIARDSAAYRRVAPLLERLASSDDSIIAEHARWALARLASGAEAKPNVSLLPSN